MIRLATLVAILVLFVVFRVISPALEGYADIIPDGFAKQGDSGNYRLAEPDVCTALGVKTDCVRAVGCLWCQHTGLCMRKSDSCPAVVDMGPNIVAEKFMDLGPINNELVGNVSASAYGNFTSASSLY